MHKTNNLVQQQQEEVNKSKSKSIRIYSSTHERLGKIAKIDNRQINQEIEFLVGERISILKKQGKVSE